MVVTAVIVMLMLMRCCSTSAGVPVTTPACKECVDSMVLQIDRYES